MSIATEISRLQTAKANIKSAIEDKGVAVPSSATLETYDEYIQQISTAPATPEYFRITSRSGGGGTITITKASAAPSISFRTSTNGSDWGNVISMTANTITVYLPVMGYVEFAGFNPSGATSTTNTYNIKVNVAHNVSGDLSTFIQTPYYPAFFQDNVNLVDASGLILPGDNLTNDAYFRMFYGCTGLTSAPAELPAMSIADRCYSQMFRNDTSLVNAPALPATSLTDSCYEAMFASCSSLATGPDLKAKVLNVKSYQNMFNGCSSLSSVVCLATDISATQCLNAFMTGVGSGGTLYCDSTMVNEWTSRVPSGWSVQVYSE
jgi:hypothetical protein